MPVAALLPDLKLDFDDVLLRPAASSLNSRKDAVLTRELDFAISGTKKTFGAVVAANMDGVGTMEMARAFHASATGFTAALHKHYPVERLVEFFSSPAANAAWYSTGITQKDQEKLQAVMDGLHNKGHRINDLCIDVPNGYIKPFEDFIKRARDLLPHARIMAGNTATDEGAEITFKAGADIAKIGIGGGSVCTTRLMTGVGVPQLSAVMEAVPVADRYKGYICSDGGCRNPDDIAKAVAAGAPLVMLGGMLAGTDEGGGERVEKNGKTFIGFYGMSSDVAQKRHGNGVPSHATSEGKYVEVAYKGPVEETVMKITGGLNSTCSYIGAKTIEDVAVVGRFQRVNRKLNNVFGGP